MKEINIEFWDYFMGFISVIPWALVIYRAFPVKKTISMKVGILFALLLGWTCTVMIIWLHPLIWPQTDFISKKKVSMLTQTVHLAFIQAGMMEEGFKIFFILCLAYVFGFDYKTKQFLPQSVLFAGFVGLGFSCVENIQYIAREIPDRKIDIFIARTIHSANIHLLINLCFGLFLLKSNNKQGTDRWTYLSYALFLAIIQHGVVDFLLIPGAAFGQWVATALFVGIWVWVIRDWKIYIKDYFEDKKTLIPASEYSSQSIL